MLKSSHLIQILLGILFGGALGTMLYNADGVKHLWQKADVANTFYCCQQNTLTCTVFVVGRDSCASGIFSQDPNTCAQNCKANSPSTAKGYCCNPQLAKCTPASAISSTSAANSVAASRTIASCGVRLNGGAGKNAISGNGRYVAVTSGAKNIFSDATNYGVFDILLYDTQDKKIERVSTATNGTQSDGNSDWPSISMDGRYVAFQSDATNIGTNDKNGKRDIFVRDRLGNGRTDRVSIGINGAEANNDSMYPVISDNGRFVVFQSKATNLTVHTASGDVWQIYLYDRVTGITRMISTSPGGTPGNAESELPSISGDGRYIAFQSTATNLIAGDANGKRDIFVYDTLNNSMKLVSKSGTAQSNGDSAFAAISSDGHYVAFSSYAKNLTQTASSNTTDIFITDLQTGSVQNISSTVAGMNVNPTMNSDGRFVAFSNTALNPANGSNIYIYDGLAKTATVMGANTMSKPEHSNPKFDSTGLHLAFTSGTMNMVSGITDRSYASTDVYIYNQATKQISLADYNFVLCGSSATN